MDPLSISGAWLHTPRIHTDSRGTFLEAYRAADLREVAGHGMDLAQLNCSISMKGALRGIHFADVPPGQAKYVMCLSGEIHDVVVDLRTGSPDFGRWEAVRLDDVSRQGLYLAEGLGHGFLTLSERATVVYAISEPFSPGREHGVHPLDASLGIEWPAEVTPILSAKDAKAPTLQEALAAGLLPDHATCLAYYEKLGGVGPPVH
ncbi:dTDP-4-dehydrorhamnose 3,5-epimerase [Microtetraspora sp. NBRC 13810]|uniref:dTDP-4-dehydrorhamnose 3,5-epimerase n=1 Tax=Microtetraspora sp. NBRC 13810 TaxID=3030990 RepID=UPI002552BE72|nr:dTDP-4-dehydrorhamnose 3,5-epimerase [Microtetraspora sp. NBRC 13810]